MNPIDFNNENLNIENLPQYQEAHYQKIAKEKLTVMYISVAIFYALVSIIILAINLFADKLILDNVLIFSILFILIILHGFYIFHAFHSIFYALRSKDVIYKNGVFNKSTTIIPFNRVQHIAIDQGIFSRWFGLADIELFTAGGNDLKIKGLYYADALKIKEFIAHAITDEEEVNEEVII